MTEPLRIEDVMSSHILECPPATPLREAARLMAEARCGSVLVTDGGRPLGIWTEHDILGLGLSDPQVFEQPVSRHMSTPVKTVLHRMPLDETALQMRADGVRHYLVVDDQGARRGVVSQTDLVLNQGIAFFLHMHDVGSIMGRRLLRLPAAMQTEEAVRRIYEAGTGAALVEADTGEVDGIVTEHDIVSVVARDAEPGLIGNHASRPVIAIRQDESVYQARALFMERHIRHLVVTDASGEAVGLLTFADLLECVEHAYTRQIREILARGRQELAENAARLRTVFEHVPEGLIFTDSDFAIEAVNPAFTEITGHALSDIVGRPFDEMLCGPHHKRRWREILQTLERDGAWKGQTWSTRANTECFPVGMGIQAVRDLEGQIVNHVVIFSDATESRRHEENLTRMAQHDPLTGLPNRRLLEDRLGQGILHARRRKTGLAVMLIDLDAFKPLNDRFGHEAGDRALRVIGTRLRELVRGADTVARIGGDEFVILVNDPSDPAGVRTVAEKAVAAIREPIVIDGQEHRLGASIGISLFPDDGEDAESLMRHADRAMYHGKNRESGHVVFWNEVRGA